MQGEPALLVSPSEPLTLNAAIDGDQEPSTSPRTLQPPPEEMQRDPALLVSPSEPLTFNTAINVDQETSMSPRTLQSPPEEMQRDPALLVSPSEPLTFNTAINVDQEPSTSLRALQSPPGEMQRDPALLVSPSESTFNTTVDGDQETSLSGDTSKSESETGLGTCPQTQRKPSMSMVILRALADKGGHSRVSFVALKKAVADTGYKMAHNTWRLKRVVKNLVNKGMLKQVTGKGALGSFRLGRKQAFKSKLKAKRWQRRRQRRRLRQRRSEQGWSEQQRSRSHQSLCSSNGHA